MIAIDTRQEYDLALSRGYKPLIDPRFDLETGLRVSIQRELFGTGHTPAENERFYRWCWAHKPHRCEECMKPLPNYSATFISHILTRGANPAMAFDGRNTNILCFACHNRWEHATTRGGMRIYAKNQITIQKLKDEYRNLER